MQRVAGDENHVQKVFWGAGMMDGLKVFCGLWYRDGFCEVLGGMGGDEWFWDGYRVWVCEEKILW